MFKVSRVSKELHDLCTRMQNLGINIKWSEAAALRRAAMTLHRWYEHECNGTIPRDEETNKPYWYSVHTGKRLYATSDRERGAQKTIEIICNNNGLYFYLQTDPRGGTLYVDMKPIPDNNYNRALFVA